MTTSNTIFIYIYILYAFEVSDFKTYIFNQSSFTSAPNIIMFLQHIDSQSHKQFRRNQRKHNNVA